MKYIFLLCFILTSTAFAQIDYKEFLSGAQVYDLSTDENSIWIATYGKGIHQYIYSQDKWIPHTTQNNSFDTDLFFCIAASKDYVWAGTADGLMILDRKRNQWRKRKFAAGGEYGNWIRSLTYDKEEDVLWIGRFKFLTKLDVAKQKYDDFDLTVNNDPKTNTIKSIRIEGKKFVWFGTEAGVFLHDKSTAFNGVSSLTYYSNKRNAFRGEGESVSVTDMLFDTQFIWFGTDEFVTDEKPEFNVGGIYRFNRRAIWEKIDKRHGIGANGIYSLSRIGNKIWVSVYQFDKKSKSETGKGIYLIDRITGKITRINPDAIALGSNTIRKMFFDGNYMWLGTDQGLWRITMTNTFAEWQPKISTINQKEIKR